MLKKKLFNALTAICLAIACIFGSFSFFNEKVSADDVFSQVYDESNYQNPYATDRIIVAFKTNMDKQVAYASKGLTLINDLSNSDSLSDSSYEIGLYSIKNQSMKGVIDTINSLKNDPTVAYAEPDYIITASDTIPNDPSYTKLYGMTKISAPAAWSRFTGSKNVVVGIIDSGVDYTHTDLANNIWTNPGEIANNGIDDDGNGYVDDIHGWNFVTKTNAPMDDNGHGTHVAGTIGAVGNNGIGVVGVAWNTQIAALKFLNSEGEGYTSDAILAVKYATKMGFDVTNNSWGGGSFSQSLQDAIAAYKGVFTAAAGNNGRNNDTRASYPANYNCNNIISIAATTSSDGRASYSNYGATSVDLGAPGDAIYSTYPNNSYATLSGTSMATPHVSGAAALIKSYYPGLTTAQIKTIILSNVDAVSSLKGKTVTGGRLNVAKCLSALSIKNFEMIQ